jgi:hypothetical protein
MLQRARPPSFLCARGHALLLNAGRFFKITTPICDSVGEKEWSHLDVVHSDTATVARHTFLASALEKVRNVRTFGPPAPSSNVRATRFSAPRLSIVAVVGRAYPTPTIPLS